MNKVDLIPIYNVIVGVCTKACGSLTNSGFLIIPTCETAINDRH